MRVRRSSLYRPEVNVKLGSAYLGMLLQELGGQMAHAVAAYNAGPHMVRRWLQQPHPHLFSRFQRIALCARAS